MKETSTYLNDSAVVLAADGFHAEAIASLRKGILLEPTNSVMWFNLGLSYHALGKPEEARRALLQAAKYNPLDVDTLDTLGVVLHELGEDSSSEECYQNALELMPENGRVWNNYGVLQFSLERFPEACRSFEKAITLVPELDDALYNLRDTYEALGKTLEMEKCSAILAKRSQV
jgi:tetratricopeptide (TPR) repeat protein